MDWSGAITRVRTLGAHPVCAVLRSLPAPPDVAVVGGTLRDLLLGRPHPDLDLAVASDPRAVAAALRSKLGGSWFVLDETFQVVRFTGTDGGIVDMALRQGTSWEDDLRRRDLTINAMGTVMSERGEACAELEILDPTGGLPDLAAGLVRATSREALEADPLRTLRVYRFAASLGFEIDPATRQWTREAGRRIVAVSWERIRDEVFKLLGATPCGPYVAGLADAGLLEVVFPELTWLRGTVSTGHFDGFTHRLEGMRALDALLSDQAPWTAEVRTFLDEYLAGTLTGGRSKLALARAALLVHGLDGFRPEADAEIRRREGDSAEASAGEGAGGVVPRRGRKALICQIADRVRLSNAEERYLIGAERGMAAFPDLRADPRIGGAALFRFFRDSGDTAAAVALLGLADFLAARDLTLEDDEGILAVVYGILAEARHPTVTAPCAPLLRGDELIAALDLPRGPKVAEVLEAIAEARAEGAIADREAAVAFAKRMLE